MTLRIEPVEAAAGPAELARYVWAGAEPDLAVHAEGAERRLVRTRLVPGAPARRIVEAWRLGPTVRALDRTVFELDRERFAEVEQYRAEGGPNLHLKPIVLPAWVGEEVRPIAGAAHTVRLGFAGRVRLVSGAFAAVVDAIRLDAEEDGQGWQLWLARGVGEIAMGPAGGGWTRELVGWSGGGASLLAGVSPAVARMVLPPLPERDDAAPRSTLT